MDEDPTPRLLSCPLGQKSHVNRTAYFENRKFIIKLVLIENHASAGPAFSAVASDAPRWATENFLNKVREVNIKSVEKREENLALMWGLRDPSSRVWFTTFSSVMHARMKRSPKRSANPLNPHGLDAGSLHGTSRRAKIGRRQFEAPLVPVV